MKIVCAPMRDTSKYRFFSFVLWFPSNFACFSPRIMSQQKCQKQKRNNPVSQFRGQKSCLISQNRERRTLGFWIRNQYLPSARQHWRAFFPRGCCQKPVSKERRGFAGDISTCSESKIPAICKLEKGKFRYNFESGDGNFRATLAGCTSYWSARTQKQKI